MPDDRSPCSQPARRLLFAGLCALAATPGARAQVAGGGRRGNAAAAGRERPPDAPPRARQRDLMAAFGAALRAPRTAQALALAPAQQGPFREFVDAVVEVGRHNERLLQRLLSQGVGSVSALDPVGRFVESEWRDGDERQQALQDLRDCQQRLAGLLDERQRAVLASLLADARGAPADKGAGERPSPAP
jgi:hypothetical protein